MKKAIHSGQITVVTSGHPVLSFPSQTCPRNGVDATARRKRKLVEVYRVCHRWEDGGGRGRRRYPIRVSVLIVHLLVVAVFGVLTCVHAARGGSEVSLREFVCAFIYFFVTVVVGSLLAVWGDDVPVSYEVRRPTREGQIEATVITEVWED